MAELDEEIVVCPSEAVRETSEALRLVDDIRGDLEREAIRLARGTGASVLTNESIKRDPLIHALHHSSRHIARLREILRLQADVPLEDHWQEERNVAVLGEVRKAQSSLLRAQTAANDTYNGLLEELGDRTNAGSSRHSEVQRRIQSCDRAMAATATALSTVTNTLSDFPARVWHPRSFSAGVSAGVVEQLARERNRRFTLPHTPNLPSAEPPVVPARVAPESQEGGITDGSSDGDRSLRRNASAALSRGSRKPSAGDSLRDAAAVDGTRTEGRETGPASSFFSHAAPTPLAANERHAILGPSPVARGGVARRHQPTTAPVMEERRRLMARASSDRFRGGSGEVGASAGGITRARGFKVSAEEAHAVRRVRKPTAAEQYAASVNLMHGRSTIAPRRRIREVGEQESSTATASTARSARGTTLATAMAARASSHRFTRLQRSLPAGSVPSTEAHADVGGQGGAATISTVRPARSTAPAAAAGRVSNPRLPRLAPSTSAGPMIPATLAGARARGDGVGYRGGGSGGGFGGARFAPTLSRRPVPMTSVRAGAGAHDDGGDFDEDGHGDSGRGERGNRGSREDSRHRTPADNSVVQEAMEEQIAQAILGGSNFVYFLDAPQSPRPFEDATRARRRSLVRMHSMGDGVDSLTASLRRSQSASRFGGRSRASVERSPSVGATSRTLAGMRGNGDVARTDVHDDEAAARRLAKQEQEAQAREDELLALRLAAREEASVERHASLSRLRRRSRRSSSPPLGLDPTTAAAVATGGEVSDAVLALQFQDIDANDFEALLTLDEQGGVGGRTCGGGRGLSEQAVEDLLRSGKVAAGGLEESCAICLVGFEVGEEIATLPCRHTFHHECIRKWLLMRNRCPTDMQPVVPDSPDAGHGTGSKR